MMPPRDVSLSTDDDGTAFTTRSTVGLPRIPEPTPGPGHQLDDVSTAGVNYADTHHAL
jgi:hypothetical protein